MKNHSDQLELFAPCYFLHLFICQHFLTQNLQGEIQLRPVPVVILYPYLYFHLDLYCAYFFVFVFASIFLPHFPVTDG